MFGGWQQLAASGWWLVADCSSQLVVDGGWRLAVGGRWRLVVGGWWSLGAVTREASGDRHCRSRSTGETVVRFSVLRLKGEAFSGRREGRTGGGISKVQILCWLT